MKSNMMKNIFGNNEFDFIRSCGADYFYKLSPELSLGATIFSSLSELMLLFQSFNKIKFNS